MCWKGKLLDLKAERKQLATSLRPAKPTKQSNDAKNIAARIWELDTVLATGSPAKVRQALSRIVSHIRLDFTPGKVTKRGQSFDLEKATIELYSKELAHRWESSSSKLPLNREP